MKIHINKGVFVLVMCLFAGLVTILSTQVHASQLDPKISHVGTLPLGNQVADYYKEVMKTDLAFESAENIENADKTDKQNIVVRKMSGIEIVITLERSLDQIMANKEKHSDNLPEDEEGGSILYVGGATIHYYKNKEAGNRIEYIQIGKTRLDKEENYTVAVSEILASNNVYPDIKVGTKVASKKKLTIQEAVENCSKKEASKSQTEGRYFGTTQKAEKEEFNLVLFIGSAVTAVLIGAVFGWLAVRKKRQIH